MKRKKQEMVSCVVRYTYKVLISLQKSTLQLSIWKNPSKETPVSRMSEEKGAQKREDCRKKYAENKLEWIKWK